MADFVIVSDRPPEEYEEFIYEEVSMLSEYDIRSVALVAVLEDNRIICGYHNMSVLDKEIVASTVRDDAMLEVVRANLKRLLDQMEEEDDGEDD